MNFAELIRELEDRGFEDLPATRRERFINFAYQRICDRQPWPFLHQSITGTATADSPLTISDLHAVRMVIDTTAGVALQWEDLRDILERDPEVEATGTPTSWYLKEEDLLVAYPTSSDTFLVRYIRVPATLSASTDTPLIPTRFHGLIVDGAAAEGYKSMGNIDGMVAMNNEFDRGIAEMESSVLVEHFDVPAQMVVTGSTDW